MDSSQRNEDPCLEEEKKKEDKLESALFKKGRAPEERGGSEGKPNERVGENGGGQEGVQILER